MWILSGDGVYDGEVGEKWKKVGRALFGAGAPGVRRPVTTHPTHWCAEQFRDESWFDFNGYQSGHRGDGGFHRLSRAARCLLEPADSAGGRCYLWGTRNLGWHPRAEEPMTHPGTGIGDPWYEAMHLPGSVQMRYMKDLMAELRWWELRPAPGDVVEQPGDQDPAKYIAVAGTTDGSVSLAYLPVGDTVRLSAESGGKARWFDPRRGKWSKPEPFKKGKTAFVAPDDRDWVLWRSFER